MRKRLLWLFCLTLALLSTSAHGQLRLPNMLSDNMVVQRNSKIVLWGWAYAGHTVKIKADWSTDTVSTVADGGGKWRVEVPTYQAGGPYRITFASFGGELQLDDVLVGDVWLCSGQSNMEWGGMQNLKEIMDELPLAKDHEIRLLQVSRYSAAQPQEDIPDRWQRLDSASLKSFSAIGYFISKEFRKELGVPIGIINASWGGTAAEVWTPSSIIEGDEALALAAEGQKAAHFRPHRVASLWNSMIYPLKNYKISGVFWYQGESNVGTWSSYDKLMKGMILSWRANWAIDFPFYFVQIAPFAYNNEKPLAALLREQQLFTARSLSKTGMVVITDLVDNIADIHPIQKKAVAHRLATLALGDHYKMPMQRDYKSPIYRDCVVKGNSIEVNFDYLSDGLAIVGDQVQDLYIAGEDKVFHPATAVIKGTVLVVSSEEVPKPIAVRFGFSETAMPNLFNKYGLPVSPFRTDDWAF